MSITLWVVQGLLAFLFALGGLMKVAAPTPRLNERAPWTKDVPRGRVRAIGVVELLGAFGLILPGITRIAPTLTVAAAVGIALLMIGAATLHYTRHELPRMAAPAVVLLLAIFIAYGRFALAPLS